MMVAAAADTDLVFVGLAGHGLWSFAGSDWRMLNRGAGAEMLDGNATKAVFAPDDPQHFWVTTIYGARGVYETFDRGDTFHAANTVSHLDEIAINLEGDKFSPWVVGGHESDHKLWTSTDQGKSRMDIGAALPDGKACTHPVVLDSDTFLVGCSYNAEGIYRSENHGGSWKQVSEHGGNASALVLSTGDILWATSAGGLVSSSDRGASWSERSPAGTFKGIGVGPIALPDDRIAALGSGGVIVSSDAGKSWKTISPALPYADATGFAYSKSQAAFFVKRNTCEDPVPKDAVMRFAWDSATAD
jgi:hypothetical protein